MLTLGGIVWLSGILHLKKLRIRHENPKTNIRNPNTQTSPYKQFRQAFFSKPIIPDSIQKNGENEKTTPILTTTTNHGGSCCCCCFSYPDVLPSDQREGGKFAIDI